MITLTLTPEDNVDYNKKRVIDYSQITKKEYEWEDVVQIFDINFNKLKVIIVHSISLYDHRLILDGVRYHVLHFYSVG